MYSPPADASRSPDGTLAFNLNLETGRVYQVEYSTNLVNWSELTNFVSTNFTQQFIDPTATNSAQRYYRLKTALP